MAISGHRSGASLRNYVGRPSSEQLRAYFDILSDALSGRPHQSQQPSFYGTVILSNLHVSVNSAVVNHKTHTLSSLFSNCYAKKIGCFSVLRFGWISLNIHFQAEKLQAKVLNSTRQTISVCELLQIVNFDD